MSNATEVRLTAEEQEALDQVADLDDGEHEALLDLVEAIVARRLGRRLSA